MNKAYADCPQDIRDTAAHLVTNYAFDDAVLEGAITAALNTERNKAKWQDISTAPKDGTVVDLWVYDPDRPDGYRVPSARWENSGLGWTYGRDNGVEFFFDAVTGVARTRATHWMPLPTPPVAA